MKFIILYEGLENKLKKKNTDGLKLRDFATNNNIKIINSFYKHKNVCTYTWTTRNFKTVIA